MRAFILAAGEGRRLRPLTDHLPKPMLEIAGRPILEHNIRLLVQHGIRDIWINTHDHPQVVKAHFGDGARDGARIRYTHEPELLGTAGALNAVRGRFDQTFAVIYGDNLATCDLSRMLDFHRARSTIGTIAAFERDDVSQSGVVTFDESSRVLGFAEKPGVGEDCGHWVSAGIFIFEPAVFAYIPREGPSDFGRDVFPAMLAAGASLVSYRMTEHLWWIDSPADYRRTAADPELGRLLGGRIAGSPR